VQFSSLYRAQFDRGCLLMRGVREARPPILAPKGGQELIQAEEQHRGHAIIEQLLADLNDGPLAHMPDKFTASAAWLAIAAMARNLARAAGTLAGRRHAKARAATIRRDLIAVAACTARHGRGAPATWKEDHPARSEPALPDAIGPPALPTRKRQPDNTAETRHQHNQ
jgi:hypothetical protein